MKASKHPLVCVRFRRVSTLDACLGYAFQYNDPYIKFVVAYIESLEMTAIDLWRVHVLSAF